LAVEAQDEYVSPPDLYCYEKVVNALDCGYYFAHPYSSWERELDEHTKWTYFPRGVDLKDHREDGETG